MILAFDTSCDDTSVALLKNKNYVNLISSQNDIHGKFGGIMPEYAARSHTETIAYLTKEALEKLNASMSDIEYIATTVGPGLLPSLLVGVSFAKALAYSYSLPIIPINHIEGHIFAPFFGKKLEFPFMALVVSGGHTHLFLIEGIGRYKIIAKTLDDAVGEAFDKVARILDLGYPGGPIIDKLSKTGESDRFNIPKGLGGKKNLNFSFSGTKTAVKNLVNNHSNLSTTDKIDIAASFQKSSIDVLWEKTKDACRENGVNKIAVSGGVSANSYLREMFATECKKEGFELFLPRREMTTDNALMIANIAQFKKSRATYDYFSVEANPRLKIVNYNR